MRYKIDDPFYTHVHETGAGTEARARARVAAHFPAAVYTVGETETIAHASEEARAAGAPPVAWLTPTVRRDKATVTASRQRRRARSTN